MLKFRIAKINYKVYVKGQLKVAYWRQNLISCKNKTKTLRFEKILRSFYLPET